MASTTRPPATRSGGPPNRLPRHNTSSHRGRDIRLGLLGVLGLLVLVVGVPALLTVFVGYPLPRHAPSSAWLTESISSTLIIKVLTCVVWLVWAHFVVCLLTEWRAIRSGRLPSRVALGGGSQFLARRLVAAALLLSGAAVTFSQLGSSGGGPTLRPPAAVQRAGVHAAAPSAATPAATPGTRDAGASERSSTAGSATAAQHAGETKYYVVSPPHGRRYDSLWDIAQRTLGDPLRYKEIFALNHGRVQADGSKLVDANLIRPGWELRLPADAHGPGVRTTHATLPSTRSAAPVAPAPHADATPAAHAEPGTTVDSPAIADASRAGHASVSAAQVAPVASSQVAGSPAVELFGGSLMLAGILAALTARRGPYGEPSEAEDALAGRADDARAADLDRALRNLVAGRTAQGRALPEPIVAWVSETAVSLTLVSGDLADPPAPWRLGPDGVSWQVQLDAVADADAAAPYPGLVSVGRAYGHELFLDLEQAPGLVALAGDGERAREVATAIAVQASTCAWSDGARVTLVGFGNAEDIARIAPETIQHVPQLSGILDDLEAEHHKAAGLRRQLGIDGVLTGRQSRRSTAWRPHLLVLSGPPTPSEAVRLQAVVGNGRSQFVAVAVGDTSNARWRFVVSADGAIDLGVIGISAAAHRLDNGGVARVAAMAALADQQRRGQATSVRTTAPRDFVRSRLAPAPVVVGEPRAFVSLLGPVGVRADGALEESKRDLLSALIVAVALHPDGAHEQVVRTSVWPRGVSDDVFRAAAADAAAWLGAGSAGRAALWEDNGRWFLDGCVRVDWDEVRRLAAAAEGPDRLTVLTRALEMFHGEAFSGPIAHSCGWLAFRRAARDARVLGTAIALDAAALQLSAARPVEAEQALRRGLVLVPVSEPLWRELLKLAARQGPEPAARVAGAMYDTLRVHKVWPEPETDALVAQLAPGYGRDQTPDAADEAIG